MRMIEKVFEMEKRLFRIRQYWTKGELNELIAAEVDAMYASMKLAERGRDGGD